MKMRLSKTVAVASVLGVLAFLVSHAHPEPVRADTGNQAEVGCPTYSPGQKTFLARLHKNFIGNSATQVVRSNLPYKASGKSVSIDGQIWASGNNYLEFYDNPSLHFTATVPAMQLTPVAGPATRWSAVISDVSVSGAVHLKRMLARVGAHNTVSFTKDQLRLDA